MFVMKLYGESCGVNFNEKLSNLMVLICLHELKKETNFWRSYDLQTPSPVNYFTCLALHRFLDSFISHFSGKLLPAWLRRVARDENFNLSKFSILRPGFCFPTWMSIKIKTMRGETKRLRLSEIKINPWGSSSTQKDTQSRVLFEFFQGK